MASYYEATARERLAGLLDPDSFVEVLPPTARLVSPHLQALDLPTAFDDGVIIGGATLDGLAVQVAAQEGGFMGGAVGEVHGAKLVGLLERALDEQPAAVLLLVEPTDLGGACRIEVLTAAVGFSPIWQAVMDDFFDRHRVADVRISINDVGATPAVVSLRLDQALEAFTGGQP